MSQLININDIELESLNNPLLEAVLICLFTEAKASPDEMPEYASGQGGCWLDNIPVTINNQKETISWGSKLWLLKRAKMTADELATAELFVAEALKPLVKAGVLSDSDYRLEQRPNNQLFITITLNNEPFEVEG